MRILFSEQKEKKTMRKTLKMFLCAALLVAALFSFSAFTSAPTSAHAAVQRPAAANACQKTVSYSDKGSTVKLAQESLNWFYYNPKFGLYSKGFYVVEDGVFGSQTRDDVKAFQA